MIAIPYQAWHQCEWCRAEFQMNATINKQAYEQGKWQDFIAICPTCHKLNDFSVPGKQDTETVTRLETEEAARADKEALEWITNQICRGNG